MVVVKDKHSDYTSKDVLEYETWLESISNGRPKSEIEFVRRACEVAQKAHEGQFRASGEPFFQHSLAVANILADLRLDSETLATAKPKSRSISSSVLPFVSGTTAIMNTARTAQKAA